MKEISYNGPEFDKEESDWSAKKERSTGSHAAPTVRTFRADVEDLIQEKGMTKAQIAMAEADRRERRGQRRVLKEEASTHLGATIFLLLIILAFGIGVGAYALVGVRIPSPFGDQAASSTPAEITPTTEDLGITIESDNRAQLIADVSIAFGKTSLPAGTTRVVEFSIVDPTGTKRKADTNELFRSMLLPLSKKTIIASLRPEPTFEIYSGTKLSGVLSVDSRFYANTYAAALEWESTMAQDLIPFLNPWYERNLLQALSGRAFKDERYQNFDIRTLSDSAGNSVLAYGFLNKKTLLIAGNRDTLVAQLIARSTTGS